MSILIRAIEVVVIVFMAVITLVVVAETALRAFAGFSLIITDELSRYLMVWTAMLAATLLVHEDGHIRIELLTQAVGPRARQVLYVVAQLVVAAFLALLIASSVLSMPSIVHQDTVTLGVSIVWFYAALPVTGALMLLLTLRNIVRHLRTPNASE